METRRRAFLIQVDNILEVFELIRSSPADHRLEHPIDPIEAVVRRDFGQHPEPHEVHAELFTPAPDDPPP